MTRQCHVTHKICLGILLISVVEQALKLQQMDVKRTYLNSTLHKTIYMQQPEGCEDGMSWVYKLVKPLYGLKQAGHEWNNELDGKLKDHEYQHLTSDPCVYIWWDNGDVGILAIWVDNSLLFASTDQMIDHMKDVLSSGMGSYWPRGTTQDCWHWSNMYWQFYFHFSTKIYWEPSLQRRYVRCKPHCHAYGPKY